MHLETARELLEDMRDCAKRADVLKYMFIGFGTMLGAVRDGGLIPYDDDMDICFLPMPAQKKEDYLKICQDKGLMDGWPNPSARMSSKPNGELLWFSLQKTKKSAKSCNWFFLEWDNCLWHTKGKIWVSDEHFDKRLKYSMNDEAIMLGAPSDFFHPIALMMFENNVWSVPSKAGTLCDEYYPDWAQPKEGGASAQNRIVSVGSWSDKTTWKYL
jgi:hypothetical protein